MTTSIWLERNIASDFLDQSFLQEFEEMVKSEGLNEVDAKLLENLEPLLTKTIDVEMESPQKVQPENQASHRIQLSLPESLCAADVNKPTSVNSPQQPVLVNIKHREQNTKAALNGGNITKVTQQRLNLASADVLHSAALQNIAIIRPLPHALACQPPQSRAALAKNNNKPQLKLTSIKKDKNMAKSTPSTSKGSKKAVTKKAGSKVQKEKKVKSPKSSIIRKNVKCNRVDGVTKSLPLTRKLEILKTALSESNFTLCKVPLNSVPSTLIGTVNKNNLYVQTTNTPAAIQVNNTQNRTFNNVKLPCNNIYAESVPYISNQNSTTVTPNIYNPNVVVQNGIPIEITQSKKLLELLQCRLSDNNTITKEPLNCSSTTATVVTYSALANVQPTNASVIKNMYEINYKVNNSQNVNQPVQIPNSIDNNTTIVTSSNPVVNTNPIANKTTEVIINNSDGQPLQYIVPKTTQATLLTNYKEPPRKKPRIFAKNSKDTKNKLIQDYIKKELQCGITGNDIKLIQTSSNKPATVIENKVQLPTHIQTSSNKPATVIEKKVPLPTPIQTSSNKPATVIENKVPLPTSIQTLSNKPATVIETKLPLPTPIQTPSNKPSTVIENKVPLPTPIQASSNKPSTVIENKVPLPTPIQASSNKLATVIENKVPLPTPIQASSNKPSTVIENKVPLPTPIQASSNKPATVIENKVPLPTPIQTVSNKPATVIENKVPLPTPIQASSNKPATVIENKVPEPTPPQVEKAKCSQCGIVFNTEYVLNLHMECVHGIKCTIPVNTDEKKKQPRMQNNNNKLQLTTNKVKRGYKTVVRKELYKINSVVENDTNSMQFESDVNSVINVINGTNAIIVENNVNINTVENGTNSITEENNSIITKIKNETSSNEKQEKVKPSILRKGVQVKKESRVTKSNIKKEESAVVSENNSIKNNKLKNVPIPEFSQKHSIAFNANGRSMNKCKYCMESYADIFVLNRHLSANHKIHEDKASCNYGSMINLFNVGF